MFVALGSVYVVAFIGLVAGWFWARWYALGVAFSGVALGALLFLQIGLEPVVLVFGGSHGALGLALVGRAMASAFEGRTDWQKRWRMDENAVNRLGKAVMRAGASLPYLIMVGLAPREESLVAIAAVGAALGLWALVRLRTWGVFALGSSGVVALAGAASAEPAMGLAAVVGALLLLMAFAPFAQGIARALLDD